MKSLFAFLFLSLYFIGNSQNNILVGTGNSPNEPAIMINPKDPAIIVAAANLNNFYYSSDTGHSWTGVVQTSSFGVWGDGVIDVDTNGNFYHFHLSNPGGGANWIDRIVCQKSLDNGVTWTDGTFTGLNMQKEQDKHWSVIDRTNNNIYVTWSQFDNYGSSNPADSSLILFSKSLDQGLTWSAPKRISAIAGDCIDEDDTVEGAVPAVGPNGEIYVAWAGPNGLMFNKSLDQGDTWLNEELQIDSFIGGWDLQIPGIQRANGLPITKCDLSGGPNHGTIYVNWSDQSNGSTDTDVWLIKSIDGGNTWLPRIRVNNDTTQTHQFFTWMDVDQTNGFLHFVYYDRRINTGNETDVYLAHSQNGGDSITNRIISETSFNPNPGVFFGDYSNISVHNNIVRPIWTRLQNGVLSIYTDVSEFVPEPMDTMVTDTMGTDTFVVVIDTMMIIGDSILIDTTTVDTTIVDTMTNVISPFNDSNSSISNYPNPVNDISYVSFKLYKDVSVNLGLYDATGNLVHQIYTDKQMGYGKYVVPLDIDQLQLPSGTYFHRLEIDGVSEVDRMIKIE